MESMYRGQCTGKPAQVTGTLLNAPAKIHSNLLLACHPATKANEITMTTFDPDAQTIDADNVSCLHVEKLGEGKVVLLIEHDDGGSSRFVITSGACPITASYVDWVEK